MRSCPRGFDESKRDNVCALYSYFTRGCHARLGCPGYLPGQYFIFALPYNEVGLGDDLNDNSPLNLLVRMLTEDFVEGSMRSMFSILFGASALIFLDEARLAVAGLQLVDYYYRRTLLLVLFGLIHAYWLLWPYDVLYAYGLFGLFLFPLRVLSACILAIIGICLLVFGGYDFN